MSLKAIAVLAVVALLGSAVHAAILPGQGFLPGGNLRTVDNDGPYNFTLLDVQANEIKVGIAAKQNYTDKDLIDYLVNAECLEGLFDTWGVFGRGFNGDLEKGGPTPIGARAANLTDETRMYLAEVALNEQGHALFTRHAGSSQPCPLIDFTGGWNKWMAAAFELGNRTIQEVYGREFDPFQNDQTFVTCVLILEELGATGNKGLIGLFTSPVLANGVAGLATSANSQATIERMVLWQMRDMIIDPFNETVQQVFARASALRDRLDGFPIVDQGLTNTDPRSIAVPFNFLNLIPTDVRGLTRNRTPQQNINILTLGNPEGKGVFFPDGLLGRLNKPTGYNKNAIGLAPIGPNIKMSYQEPVYCVGDIPPPITGPQPSDVPDMLALTQAIDGVREDRTYRTRGYITYNSSTPYFDEGVQVGVGAPNAGSKYLFKQEMQNQH